ncbi:flagellar hook-associated protein FlgK [Paenibacillus sp.]|uniref:flagellar hook-associated protein FlgK n=1 Tax=Paenibacillus sp. TaxID=58172 RepID=UPI002D42337C|nr:flagellar hook-associated protein FlgK [Paenibacillus sp.]HZG87387.1 flagellar hook-associated protein FlgK [Paenibacillus sp.]
MRSSFSGLEIAKRSLFTHQAALSTTGHNVANANTRGYTRQVVNMTASSPIEAVGLMRSGVPGQMGQGVEFSSITRVREQFLDKQFYNENKSLGQWTVRKETLEKLEAIINEPSDTGLNSVLNTFWSSWQELSKAPDNLEARALVKESSLALADSFNHAARQLSDLKSDLSDSINVKAGEVNSLLTQIARLNEQIYRNEGLGDNANDLRDRRDVLVDDLSKIINLTVQDGEQGYTISMGSEVLVEGNVPTEFDSDLVTSAYAEDGSGDLNSGELFGLIYSKDRIVTGYQNQLDALVTTIAAELNAVHQTGYTLEHPVTLGGEFFQFAPLDPDNPKTAAERFRLHPDIANDVEKIATSARTYTDANGVVRVVRGNNEVALQIAQLRNQKFNFDGSGLEKIILNGGTFDEFLRAVVGEIGIQAQEATRQSDNQQTLVDQIDARRQSVSGVSLDEEMSNMIKFQHAYNAAARALTTFDEMLDKVINGMGTVGR